MGGPDEMRRYRQRIKTDLVSFQVVVKETDLWVSADTHLETETRNAVLTCRHQLETYISDHPEFANSLGPYEPDPYAPPIVRKMVAAAGKLGVGPMASVAGAIAQQVGEDLLRHTDQVVVENGGDIFMKTARQSTVSIFAGGSPLSGRVGLRIHERQMPLGICSSSGTIGHSLSMGKADAVCILSPSAALADAAATALGNHIRGKKDLQNLPAWSQEGKDILGGVVIVGDTMASWGDVELVGMR
jgi:hypothetical protein